MATVPDKARDEPNPPTQGENISFEQSFAEEHFATPLGNNPFTWSIPSPAVGAYKGPWLPRGYTIKSLEFAHDGAGSIDFNFEIRDNRDLAGVDILSAEQTSTNASQLVETGFINRRIERGQFLTLDISAVNGAVGYFVATIAAE